MNGPLAGKTALVTGASRGIGREIALKLAGDGALVAVHYSASEEGARGVLAAIEAAGGSGFLLRADLASTAEIAGLFEALDRELAGRGIDKLDILVNNAGIGVQGDVETTSEADFDRVFAINVKGCCSSASTPRRGCVTAGGSSTCRRWSATMPIRARSLIPRPRRRWIR